MKMKMRTKVRTKMKRKMRTMRKRRRKIQKKRGAPVGGRAPRLKPVSIAEDPASLTFLS